MKHTKTISSLKQLRNAFRGADVKIWERSPDDGYTKQVVIVAFNNIDYWPETQVTTIERPERDYNYAYESMLSHMNQFNKKMGLDPIPA